jgi:signal transduction histidine kinase
VSVCSTTEVLTFAVTDDGPGFDPSTASESHGFTNMRDRLGAVGGTLKIDSAPGAGTRVCGSIPSAPLAVTPSGR